MTAHRRVTSNFALERAVEWAADLGLPLVVFEALRADYPWASDRLHSFVLDGMIDTRLALTGRPGVTYFPYVEPARGAARGLLEALADRAAVVVTDDYPAFFLPRMLSAAAPRIRVRFEAVDGNGLLPIREARQLFPTAYTFRRYLQRGLADSFPARPLQEPLAGLPRGPADVPRDIQTRWATPFAELASGRHSLAALPIDHSVPRAPVRGGARAAQSALASFLEERLGRYAAEHNQVHQDVASGLSPYLHFGHLSSWDVFDRVMQREGWLGELPRRSSGARAGWWGVSDNAEQFLDQLVTWRELGFNMCAERPDDYDRYESLPSWARASLDRHRGDRRDPCYDLATFDAGLTADPLWNAAQAQLRQDGRIHNYLRMLWGKKILEWSATPEDALAVMVELNNRYALDGRDPNSYSGIFWTLGRYDRPWAPERPVYGTIRYMSSANTARKMRVTEYIRRYQSVHRTQTLPL
jgi:deoxyribodipyrimidine photo-lyase